MQTFKTKIAEEKDDPSWWGSDKKVAKLEAQANDLTMKILSETKRDKEALAEMMANKTDEQIAMLKELNVGMAKSSNISQQGIDELVKVGAITEETGKAAAKKLDKLASPMPPR